MNRDTQPNESKRDAQEAAPGADHSHDRTPAPDMQAEDAGTPASGTSAAGAMKQTSKTSTESGTKR